jgi:hypothetical protein
MSQARRQRLSDRQRYAKQFMPVGRPSKIIWDICDWFPHHYGFCPDAEAWYNEMKRIGITDAKYPTSDGTCSPFVNDGFRGGSCSIVTLNDKKRSNMGVIALLTHESVHVFQHLCDNIGESRPSKELEAYAIQNITKFMISAYEQTRGKIVR